MEKKLIIFIAPPGGGKGTQADMLARQFGFAHLETSKIIEEKLKTADPNDAEMQKEKQVWLNGGLTDPRKVVGWFTEVIDNMAGQGKSVVLSGSLRTLYEAKEMVPELERLYGRDHIKVFNIALSEEESVKRNSNRRICEKNRHPIPNFPEYRDIEVCPWDGSPLITRGLDKPEVIKERYRHYLEETMPALDYIKNQGFKVYTINGDQPIEKVHEEIMRHFD